VNFRSSFLLLLMLLSTIASADNKETKQQLDSVKTEIEALNQDLSKNKKSKAALYEQLKKQSRSVSELNKDLLILEQNIKRKKQQLAELERQVSSQQQSHTQQLEALNDQIRTSFINGKPSVIKVLLNQHNPATLARTSQYFHYYHQARQQQLEKITSTLTNLSLDQKNLYSAQKQQQRLYEQQSQKKKQLHSKTKQRQTTLALLEGKINDQGSRLSALHEQEKSLKALLASLNKPKAKTPTSQIPYKGSSFGQRSGSLPWPLKGKIVARYGSSRNVGKLTWQGILISSAPGTNIVASAPGKVIFADWLRGFGLLIIIDHGDQYMTLYGNNETLLKQVGDTVSTGELIAQSGDKGVRQHAGLYFEVRHKGSPTNPLKWLSKRS